LSEFSKPKMFWEKGRQKEGKINRGSGADSRVKGGKLPLEPI